MILHPSTLAAVRASAIAAKLRANRWQLDILTPAERQFCRDYRRTMARAS